MSWLQSKITARYESKHDVLGPNPKHSKGIRVLNRVLSWTEKCIEYEADQGHADHGSSHTASHLSSRPARSGLSGIRESLMIAEDTGAVASRRRDLHGVGREARLTRCKTSTLQVVSEVELLILLLVAVATSAISSLPVGSPSRAPFAVSDQSITDRGSRKRSTWLCLDLSAIRRPVARSRTGFVLQASCICRNWECLSRRLPRRWHHHRPGRNSCYQFRNQSLIHI